MGKLKADIAFDAELAAEMNKRTKRLGDQTVDLAIQVKDAREFISWASNHIRPTWMDWMKEANQAVADMTQLRMALNRETTTVLTHAKDVVQFYTSPEYVKAHETFREMMELLNRFEQLKENGTMNAFADFILKVTCK